MADAPNDSGSLDIALWLDPAMLGREAAFTRHFVTGLRSEGHQVTFIVPPGLDISTLPSLGSRVLEYHAPRWEHWLTGGKATLLNRLRLARLIAQLQADPPDVLLLWGSSASADPPSTVPPALPAIQTVTAACDIPLLLWCWDARELFTPLLQLPRLKHLIVSSQPILDRLEPNGPIPATLVHPGVYTDELTACYDVDGQVACLVCLDPLSNLQAYEALLRACRRLADENLEFLLFAYDQGRHEHPIWRLAQSLNLLDHISFVPFQQEAEPLLLHGDLYLHVLPTSRVQYSTLDAMGKGLAIVRGPNPGADFLVDGQTCRLVPEPTAEAWHAALAEMIRDRPRALALAKRGQNHVRQHHPMTRMLTQFLALARQAAARPIRWPNA